MSSPISMELFRRIDEAPSPERKLAELQFMARQSLSSLSPEEQAEFYDRFTRIAHSIPDSEYGSIVKSLPDVLGNSPGCIAGQQELAFSVAKRYEQRGEFANAIQYAAKSLQIAERREDQSAIDELDRFMTGVLIRAYPFGEEVERARSELNPERMRAVLRRLSVLRRFLTKTVFEEICYQVLSALNAIPSDKYDRYKECAALLESIRNEPFPETSVPITREYRTLFAKWRAQFSQPMPEGEIREVQRELARGYRSLFRTIFSNVAAIVGPPPGCTCSVDACTCYDIVVMGSAAREEVCPFSDLEIAMLVRNDKAAMWNYCKTLLECLELHIRSLGETAEQQAAFSAIHEKNPSGFHLDVNPLKDKELIGTPAAMAERQSWEGDHQSAGMLLYCAPLLFETPSALYLDYKEALRERLSVEREGKTLRAARALALVSDQQRGYVDKLEAVWKYKDYVQQINFLMAAFSTLYEIDARNTLDILDALEVKGVFTARSIALLKEVVGQIYQLRVHQHLRYEQQCEEIPLGSNELFLTRVEVLVLYPLYHLLDQWNGNRVDLFETVFTLATSAVEEPSRRGRSKREIVALLASYLVEKSAPIEEHQEFFKRLSVTTGYKELRAAYFDAIRTNEEVAKVLSEYPDPSGFRFASLLAREELKRRFMAATTDVRGPATVISPLFGKRYLRKEQCEVLFDEEGRIRNGCGGMHHVSALGDLHWKELPHQPLVEYGVHDLGMRLAGELTPATELVSVAVDGKPSYPVLLSSSVVGATLEQEVPTDPDRTWLSWHLILAAVTKPGDGIPSNYICDENKRLFAIDSDISFVEPVISSLLWTKVQFTSVLFSLYDDPIPLDPHVVSQFCSLDIDLLLCAWIEAICAKEKEYVALFRDRWDLFYRGEQKSTPYFLVLEGAMTVLHQQMLTLQKRLRETEHPTSRTLLEALLSLRREVSEPLLIGRYVVKAYDKKKGKPPSERLEAATARTARQSLSSRKAYEAAVKRLPSEKEIADLGKISAQQAKEELFCCQLTAEEKAAIYRLTGGEEVTMRGNFDELDKERHRFVLEALGLRALENNYKLVNLSLAGCKAVSLKLLLPFLSPELRVLNLSHCDQVDRSLLSFIAKKAPNVEILKLNGTAAKAWTIPFAKLKELEIGESPSLESVVVEAVAPKSLQLQDSPKLRALSLPNANTFPQVSCRRAPLLTSHFRLSARRICKTESDWTHLRTCYEEISDQLEASQEKIIVYNEMGWASEQLGEGDVARGYYEATLELYQGVHGIQGEKTVLERLIALTEGEERYKTMLEQLLKKERLDMLKQASMNGMLKPV